MRRKVIVLSAVLAILSGLVRAETKKLVLPVAVEERFVSGRWPRYTTIMRVVNRGTESAQLALAAYDNSGALLSNVRFLSGDGSDPIRVQTDRPNVIVMIVEDDPIFEGWVEITVDEEADILVTAELKFFGEDIEGSVYDSHDVLGMVQVPARPPSTQHHGFTQVTLIDGKKVVSLSAYAFVNPNDQHASVEATYVELYSTEVKTRGFVLPPRGRSAQLLTELFQGVVPDINITPPRVIVLLGSLEVRSDVPIGVGAIDLLLPEGRLSGGVMEPVN